MTLMLNEEIPTPTTMLRENVRDAIRSFYREIYRNRNIFFLGSKPEQLSSQDFITVTVVSTS